MNKMLQRMLFALTIMLTLVALAGPSLAKSLYVITDHNSTNGLGGETPPTPVKAYLINGNGTLSYQTTFQVPNVTGAMGLAIDTASATLFITVRSTGTLQILDAGTMAYRSSFPVPGASDLAGIVMDEKKGLLYTMDFYTANLYVYSWSRATKTLSAVGTLPIVLQTPPSTGNSLTAYGISLDTVNDRLYVANGSSLYIYNTSDWSLANTGTPGQLLGVIWLNNSDNRPPRSVALDSTRQLLYTGGAGWGSGNDTNLIQTNLKTGEAKMVDVSTTALPTSGVMGLGIDNATGDVYITTGDGYDYDTGGDLIVYDTSLNLKQRLSNIGSVPPLLGSPMGLAIDAPFSVPTPPTLW